MFTPPTTRMPATGNGKRSMEEVMVRAAEHAKKEETFQKGGFEFISRAGHILESQCHHSEGIGEDKCLKCVYNRELKLEELPEMVFARNSLTIKFGKNGSIEFNALDALKMVIDDKLPDVQVGASNVWQSARSERIKQITTQHKPFDWTFTTKYRGTVENCQI
ncbi:unnamed protein product [Caenorhabditis angaria]|uniref:TIP41-like protein n=1 Tax=Caenorhabditis angaria TaxID=860376 RepID=A0A9P1IH76_9PELO|nr:unnamed protein product [Caenorhabditis angaria]